MRPSLYESYVFLICLASLGGAITSLLGGLHAVLGIVEPEWMMNDYQWAYHQSNDRYWEHIVPRHRLTNDPEEKPPRPSEDELTRRRMESFDVERHNVRRGSQMELVMFGAGLGISLAMFTVHWQLARTYRSTPPAAAPQTVARQSE